MQRAIITGASSGIGLALARELARRGYSLALLARRTELLEELAAELNGRGGKAIALSCDVTDLAQVREAVREGEEKLGGAFDLAVANAGLSISGHATKFNVAGAEEIMRVNYFGMLYLFDAVIGAMIERKSGRFAGVASIAGLRALPSAGPYSASKAAMQAFLEAARIELVPYGVGVTTVNPGFIDTPMTKKNRFHMPFLMTAEEAAQVIAEGLDRGARLIEFPKPMSLLLRTLRLVPDAIFEAILVPFSKRKNS